MPKLNKHDIIWWVSITATNRAQYQHPHKRVNRWTYRRASMWPRYMTLSLQPQRALWFLATSDCLSFSQSLNTFAHHFPYLVTMQSNSKISDMASLISEAISHRKTFFLNFSSPALKVNNTQRFSRHTLLFTQVLLIREQVSLAFDNANSHIHFKNVRQSRLHWAFSLLLVRKIQLVRSG